MKPGPPFDAEYLKTIDHLLSPSERRYLHAWIEHGSSGKAAKHLGIGRGSVLRASSNVKIKVARRGYFDRPKAFSLDEPVPDGFLLKGQSALMSPDGRVLQRWDKTKQEGMPPEDEPQMPDPKRLVSLSKLHDAEGRVINYWTKERAEKAEQERLWQDFAKALAAESEAKWEPLPEVQHGKRDGETLTSYLVGDHHIGMLAWAEETGGDSYDTKIAEDLIKQATDALTQTASIHGGRGLVVFLGDLMHYDGLTAETPTSHHRLDPDSRYGKVVRTTVRSVRHVIGRALEVHTSVKVIVEIGNHDLSSMIYLTELLANFYEDDPRVEVDTSPAHFHYHKHGRCLIGVHHGHGRKLPDLPLIMAADRPQEWGRTRYRYWWTGHVHHDRILGDANSGCRVESVRVLAPADAWTAQKGYRTLRDMKAVVYHERFGEVARYTVNPEMFTKAEEPK